MMSPCLNQSIQRITEEVSYAASTSGFHTHAHIPTRACTYATCKKQNRLPWWDDSAGKDTATET